VTGLSSNFTIGEIADRKHCRAQLKVKISVTLTVQPN